MSFYDEIKDIQYKPINFDEQIINLIQKDLKKRFEELIQRNCNIVKECIRKQAEEGRINGIIANEFSGRCNIDTEMHLYTKNESSELMMHF